MKRKIAWLLLSCLVVLSLLLTSCAPTAPTTPTAPTAPTTPTAPTAPAVPAVPEKEAVTAAGGTGIIYSQHPSKFHAEKPKYGGVLNDIEANSIQGFAPVTVHKSRSTASNFDLESLWGGDWTKGAAGTIETGFFISFDRLWGFGARLAESYERPAPDTLIFHIRKGVHWALNPNNEASRLVGGRELTAQDVAFSLNAWFSDPETYWKIQLIPEPNSIEATDKYTVVIKAKPEIMSDVIYNVSDFSAIFPPEVYQKYNKMRDWSAMVGTGPFMITDYVVDNVVTYKRNPNYWDKDPIGPGKGNQLPYLDGIKLFIIKDRSTRMAALRAGKVDLLEGAAPGLAGLTWEEGLQILKTNPEMNYAKYLSRNANGIQLRIDKPELPWYNREVRRAMTMAIDYNTLIKDYFKGNADLVYPIVPYPEYMGMYTPMNEQPAEVQDMYTYQPEKAKQILAKAGYPNGFKLEVLTQSTSVDELSILKEYLAKIGVDVEIQVKESTVFISTYSGFNHKHAVYKGLSTSVPYAFHSTIPTDTSNSSRINDPYANKMYEDTRADYMFNEPKLLPMMKEFKQWELALAASIQFPGAYVYHMWQPWLKNYHGEDYLGISNRHYWAKYVWIDQQLKKARGF